MLHENNEMLVEENAMVEIEEIELKANSYNNCCKFINLE